MLKQIALVAPSLAFANEAAAEVNPTANLVMLGGMVVIFYFMLWRPQAKKAKAHATLVSSLSTGDEVVLSSGIMGKISKIKDNYVNVAIDNGSTMLVKKAAVEQVLPKGTLEGLR